MKLNRPPIVVEVFEVVNKPDEIKSLFCTKCDYQGKLEEDSDAGITITVTGVNNVAFDSGDEVTGYWKLPSE